MKDQALSFSETPFEYNQDQILLRVQSFQKLGLKQQLCIYKRVNVLLNCL